MDACKEETLLPLFPRFVHQRTQGTAGFTLLGVEETDVIDLHGVDRVYGWQERRSSQVKPGFSGIALSSESQR